MVFILYNGSNYRSGSLTRRSRRDRGYRRPCDDAATKQSEVSLLTGTSFYKGLREIANPLYFCVGDFGWELLFFLPFFIIDDHPATFSKDIFILKN